MARRSALPESVSSAPPASIRCGVCDSGPAFRCPSCTRGSGRERDDVGGFACTRRIMGRADVELAECHELDARIARTLAVTHEAHPSYPHLVAEYQANAMRLGELRSARRARLLLERRP